MKSKHSYSTNPYNPKRPYKFHLILLGLISALCLINCTKEDNITSCLLAQTTQIDAPHINQSYTYDIDSRMIERASSNLNSTTTDVIDYVDNKISRITTTSPTSPCRIDLYQYDTTGKLDRIIHEIAIDQNCQNTDTIAITEYFYTNNEVPDSSIQIEIPGPNSPLLYDKIKYIYDSNENITRIESYNLDALETTTDFEYDDSINPLYGYFKNGKNNPTKEHNTSIVLQSELILSYRNESRNELNIPTRIFRLSSQNIYTEVEFEHQLVCQ